MNWHQSSDTPVSELPVPAVLFRPGAGAKAADEHVDYTWGESVSWTYPGRITVPLNRGGRYVADLVMGTDETGVLIDMLTDAANPENRGAHDRRRTLWKDQDAYDRDQASDSEPEDAIPGKAPIATLSQKPLWDGDLPPVPEGTRIVVGAPGSQGWIVDRAFIHLEHPTPP